MSSMTCSIPLIADRLLPQRDLLLDGEFMAEFFSRELGSRGPIAIERCEHIRSTYRAGESLRVAYKVFAREGTCVVTGRAFSEVQSAKSFEAAQQKAVKCGPFRPVLHDPRTESIFWTFPNDRRIVNLPLLVEIPQELAQLFGARWTRSNIVAYAPENCATAQCLTAEDDVLAYAKVYASDHNESCFRTYLALKSSAKTERAQIDFPEVIYHSPERHILVLQPLRGRRLADIQGGELAEAYSRLGHALACLHALPAPAHLPEFPRFADSYLQLAASRIGLVRPELAQQTSELCDALRTRKKQWSEQWVCLHGDVHPKNGILLETGSIALIDLDQASLGPSAADLGSLLAALRYERHIGLLTDTEERMLADAFLSGYQQIGKLPEQESLRWHMAAALFAERAFRAVSRIRLAGLQRLPELLNDAQRLLGEPLEAGD
jgi:aminoglycoside phosphotransferase